MRYLFPILITLTLIGCSDGWNTTSNKYQLVVSSDGHVYRMDTRTGDVVVIEQVPMHKLSQSDQIPLVVNALYKTEEGEVIRYAGKGKFEARRPLSDFDRK